MDRGLGNFPEYRRPVEDGEDSDALVSKAIQEAISFVDDELGPERAEATEYYQGKPFGNEEKGRSQAVLTEVRDGIIGVLPSILRVLHGPEHPVDFVPKRGDAVEMAAQATDYVRYVYEEDNNGFEITHSVLKDGLLKRLGIVKWGLDEGQEVVTTKYKGLSREDLALLLSAPNAEPQNVRINEGGSVDCEIAVTRPSGRLWVMPVPPDDFFWNREARSLDDALLVGHRLRLTRSQLIAMGVKPEVIDEFGGRVGVGEETIEEQARRQSSAGALQSDPEMGAENERIIYVEAYMMLDVQGNGVAELRKVCAIGNGYHVIKNKPASEKPFAIFSPDPEPHAMIGGSYYDRLKDLQKINSQLLRSLFDSLGASIFPRTAYVDGQVHVGDIMNSAIGAPIRMRQPGMVQTFEHPFTGEKVMPVLQFMQQVRELRIGQKDGAGSLDIDALQSTGAEAVNAAITAASAQPELIARFFVEQLMKPMFRGLLRLACRPESRERIIRLRGTYVPVNPAMFDPSMDVSVNVALGAMDVAKKIAVLEKVVADQSAILAQYGPENPVVDIAMLRNAKARILALQGIKDVDNYYKAVDPNWQPPPPEPPAPSPDELWIQAEKEMAFQKSMKELAIKQDELRLAEEKQAADNAFRDRELALREREAEMELLKGPHNAEIERYKADTTAAGKAEEIASREALERERLALEARKLEVEAELRRYEVDKQAEAAKKTARAVKKNEAPAK